MEVRRISVSIRGLGKGIIKASGLICLCAGLWVVNPMDSQAAVKQAEVQTRSSYVVKIEAPAVDVHRSASEGSARQGQVMRGQTYEVLGRTRPRRPVRQRSMPFSSWADVTSTAAWTLIREWTAPALPDTCWVRLLPSVFPIRPPDSPHTGRP